MDVNFKHYFPTGLRIKDRQLHKSLRETLQRDFEFLREWNIMDYSLYVLIGEVVPGGGGEGEGVGCIEVEVEEHHRREKYHVKMAIIDFLGDYTLLKKVESGMKSLAFVRFTLHSDLEGEMYSSKF